VQEYNPTRQRGMRVLVRVMLPRERVEIPRNGGWTSPNLKAPKREFDRFRTIRGTRLAESHLLNVYRNICKVG